MDKLLPIPSWILSKSLQGNVHNRGVGAICSDMNNMHAMINTIFVGENFVGVILYPHILRIFSISMAQETALNLLTIPAHQCNRYLVYPILCNGNLQCKLQCPLDGVQLGVVRRLEGGCLAPVEGLLPSLTLFHSTRDDDPSPHTPLHDCNTGLLCLLEQQMQGLQSSGGLYSIN